MSYSELCNKIGDDPEKLKSYIVDIVNEHTKAEKKRKDLEEQLEKAKREESFCSGKVVGAFEYGQKNFESIEHSIIFTSNGIVYKVWEEGNKIKWKEESINI